MARTLTAKLKSVTSYITTPQNLAHRLEWKKQSGGNLLNLHIRRESIDVAVASHPACDQEVHVLPSVPIKTKTIDNKWVLEAETVEELDNIVEEWDVCGTIVSWPVRKEGWCGAACGRVLHTLDGITEQSDKIVSSKRPICLWDRRRDNVPPPPVEDAWGRTPIYTEPSEKTVYVASEEDPHTQGPVEEATSVWDSFCEVHWPQLYQEHKTFDCTVSDDDCFDGDGNYKTLVV